MRLQRLAILGILTIMLAGACAAATAPFANRGGASTGAPPAPAAESRPASAPRPAAAVAPGAPAADTAQQNLPGLDRMIIRTVNMTIGVANVQEAFRQVERIASEQGGFVASSQIRQEGERMSATVTIRVPADPATYQVTLERLRALAERVIDEASQAQDITEEYVDLDSRLRNLRASEESLLSLLSRAQRVEDILAIQRELTNVRGQIEQIQGRKQALERRSEMATINLQLRETATFAQGSWDPSGVAAEALRALLAAIRGLATVAIWLLVWAPLWGGLLVVIWLARRYVRNPFRLPRRLALDPPREATPRA